MFQLYILTDCSLSQVPGGRHDLKEVSLESRRENYQTESRKFEHSLGWRLVLFSLGIYEGGVRGVRKPQNRTEISQKTANRIGFFPNTETARTCRPQYENVSKTCDIF